MKAEIITMSHSCKEFFPIIDMVDLLGHSVAITVGDDIINV